MVTIAQPTTRWALAGISLSMLMSTLGISIANVALPTLAVAFGASFAAVQWVVLAYLLATTTLIVSIGRLGDLLGRRRLLLAGILVFTAASVLCGLSPALWILVAARAIQGLGAAVLMALTLALVGAAVPKERTGRAMGLLGTMSAIGTALGPSLGGVLISAFGWRAIFLVQVPLGVAAFLLAQRFLPADRPAANRVAFDHLGTVLLAITLGAYALAVTLGHGRLLVIAAAGAALFVVVERKAAAPLIRLTMFRSPVLSAGLAMSTLVSTVLMATLVVGPFYLSRALGLAPALVGLVMSAGPVIAALTGIPAGRLVDRLGPQRITTLGLTGIAAGSLALFALPRSLATYVGPLVVITAGYALFQAANNTAVLTGIGPDRRGVVSGMLTLSRNLGLITGTSVLGALFARATATPDLTTAPAGAVATGMRITFATAAALIALAIVIALVSRSRDRGDPTGINRLT